MCRLALINKEGFNELEGKYGVEEYFDYLEKNNGGHGNGYVLIKSGQIIAADKGVKLQNKAIVGKAKELDFDWIIYHTRITSQGTTCDEQCHPFVSPDKDYALCMNGTETTYGKIGKLLGTSDTDAIFRIWHSLNLPDSELATFTSRFIGFRKQKGKKKGKVFFTNPIYQPLEFMTTKNKKSIVVGSTFPTKVKSKTVKKEFYWEEGKEIETLNSTSSYSPYVGRQIDYSNTYYYEGKSENINKGYCPECQRETYADHYDSKRCRWCYAKLLTEEEVEEIEEEERALVKLDELKGKDKAKEKALNNLNKNIKESYVKMCTECGIVFSSERMLCTCCKSTKKLKKVKIGDVARERNEIKKNK